MSAICGERTLVTFDCPCGLNVSAFYLPTDRLICLDCRADADRHDNGWNPANSVD